MSHLDFLDSILESWKYLRSCRDSEYQCAQQSGAWLSVSSSTLVIAGVGETGSIDEAQAKERRRGEKGEW